ncbi:helix-turn-helix domain-containing protein [Gymnodinialimonas sp. 2305UL16-5]|uniref:AraC family transcriptional regulator n=1 Tax=Gymnodinialimonas mytili TaxID=3126503 RepID=UPI0030A52A8B
MLTLPLPLIVALILGFLALRHAVAADRSVLFLMLLMSCALQALLVSLTQHYGLVGLAKLQPITAAITPGLAWLTFQSAALHPVTRLQAALHALGPLFIIFCIIFAPATLDAVLSGIFAGYGIAILIRLKADETLPLTRLGAGPLPRRIWSAVGVMLILSALSDAMIAIALAAGNTALPPLIISIFTSFALLGIGLLSLSPDADGPDDPSASPPEPPISSTEAEADLIVRLDALMSEDQLYLDPDLTLTRLAHRLHVPIKQLSAAINRVTGENVSRYVNGYRVRHACARLEAGASVTEAMLDSGFNTKSNFNREFARVMGHAPSAHLLAASRSA